MSTSAELRAANAAVWNAATNHRFVDEIWRGAVPVDALTTYLVQDNQFLDAFVAMLGTTVATADRAGARMTHARQLGVLAGPENDFFARALDALDVPAADRITPPLLAPTAGFLDLMEDARASADYATCLTVLLVAEWLYLGWATRPGAQPPDDPIQREWIELHRGPEFERWVAFLRTELDRVVPAMSVDGRARVAATFTRAVELELAFFDGAYG